MTISEALKLSNIVRRKEHQHMRAMGCKDGWIDFEDYLHKKYDIITVDDLKADDWQARKVLYEIVE